MTDKKMGLMTDEELKKASEFDVETEVIIDATGKNIKGAVGLALLGLLGL